jgi:DNA-binding transcriptional LysR family regulator
MDAHLRDLRYFVAVADELNFTRAAERLHLSQPALSKQIRGLETALRAQLFRRDRRQVQLTAAGTVLHTVARRLLDDWDDGAAAVADAAAEETRLLRVGTLTSIGRELYPGIMGHFSKRQPGWTVELRSFGWGDPTAGLSDQVTDAAFLWLPADAADVEFEVLATERRFVALSSQHPLAGREAIEFAEIAGEPFAALPASAGSARDFWLAAGRRAGRPARVAAEVTSADEVFEIVSSGAAVTLLAEGNAVVYSRPGITCIPVVDLEPAQLAVAWRRRDRRPAVRDFIRACRDAAADRAPNRASQHA